MAKDKFDPYVCVGNRHMDVCENVWMTKETTKWL